MVNWVIESVQLKQLNVYLANVLHMHIETIYNTSFVKIDKLPFQRTKLQMQFADPIKVISSTCNL